ncbi:CLRN [Lepeophtheirus salmonis]|uniref:CLRN n=1 Tax=Lepeophtheirus salmonis TaxID=72036 RepID=A0A7R8D476_LEPSM|nr:CLRN [Lepeophtheirus salmonis]CAF3021543.1 CLRN [Lepeophtheirus salmonis]
MNVREKTIIFSTFLSSCLAISLLGASLGTDNWVESKVYREANVKAYGYVHFGLFKGARQLNHGFGERNYPMDISDIMFHEQKFMNRDLYVTTVAMLIGGIFFGGLTVILSLLNTASDPREAVCHFPGLIALNSLAAICSLTGIATWVAQFSVRLKTNVLIREDTIKGGWSSEGLSFLGHSFCYGEQ